MKEEIGRPKKFPKKISEREKKCIRDVKLFIIRPSGDENIFNEFLFITLSAPKNINQSNKRRQNMPCRAHFYTETR